MRDDVESVHLIKLAVGVSSLEAFEKRVAERRESGIGMQVWTRSFPKRSAAILSSGSLFWVVCGTLAARQRVIGIEKDIRQDGSRCTRIDVEPVLVRVMPRAVRPFQGWRYLDPAATPADLPQVESSGLAHLPPDVLRHLRELCLV